MKHDMNNNVVLAVHFFVAGVVVHLLTGYSFNSINNHHILSQPI